MKLLFDHNLSYRLVAVLADLYPGSAHVREVGLRMALYEAVWSYAAQQGFVLVSKDTDFYQRSPRIRLSSKSHLASCRELFNE